jgi:hypothetical protein
VSQSVDGVIYVAAWPTVRTRGGHLPRSEIGMDRPCSRPQRLTYCSVNAKRWTAATRRYPYGPHLLGYEAKIADWPVILMGLTFWGMKQKSQIGRLSLWSLPFGPYLLGYEAIADCMSSGQCYFRA